ncbi:MAG: hypothetical protein HRF43_13825 [Phycisphaerae bacterium]
MADLRRLAVRALRRMYRPSERLFAFRLRREAGRDVLEGVSPRYTAIVLIALANESADDIREILGRGSVGDVLNGLANLCTGTEDLGAVALSLWAARAHGHSAVNRLLRRLREMRPDLASYPTVEVAWSLSALTAPGCGWKRDGLALAIAERLMRSFRPGVGLFPHWPADAQSARFRGHVACFADWVYPLQALSFYHAVTGSQRADRIARAAAARMCGLQGHAGQWWWHYDLRVGRVLERYPVYAIHQDAMGPMALFDAAECCGGDYAEAVTRSMDWLIDPPELPASLVDREADVIWRKVARREPHKLVRNLQAGLSLIHPLCRLPKVDVLFPPCAVDDETRPYHMGWLLYAWNPARIQRLWGERLDAGSGTTDARRPPARLETVGPAVA